MKTNVLKFDRSRRLNVSSSQRPLKEDDFALEVFLIVDHEETKQAIKTALGYAP